ncbi:kinase-like domain-containing protein [Mucidula mucida]|nr:kinase-like domain-containing protein [Mucidula mucida]
MSTVAHNRRMQSMMPPKPPTARAAGFARKMAKPPPMIFSHTERTRPTIQSQQSAQISLQERATQPIRPSFAAFRSLPAGLPAGFGPDGDFTHKTTYIHSSGIRFGDETYDMRESDLVLEEELGEGHYGSVRRVIHKPSNRVMAMKETKISFQQNDLERIILELEVLHRARAPNIVQFYGAFTAESLVYSIMEYMDAGSLDKLTFKPGGVYAVGGEELVWDPIPEDVLARICASMVAGLKALKDDLDVMHRDVKPTNVLMNTKGEVKLCDFGVSKHLENSMAKTNIGCQSYMAPERIQGESAKSISEYTVAADVWSLGLSAIEISLGEYPYPANTYNNVFAQLQCILSGELPCLPSGYSAEADHWVSRCLDRNSQRRASYVELLEHPWLKDDAEKDVDVVGWVRTALKFKGSRCIRAPPRPDENP